MDSRLTSVQYISVPSDTTVYVHRSETGIVILAIHVDNVMSFVDSEQELEHMHTQLHRLFEMKCKDPCWLMGFQLIDDREACTILILHQCYIETILDRFNMGSCTPKESPMHHSTILSKEDGLHDEYKT